MQQRFRAQAHGVTNAGPVREHNEDEVACFPDDALYVVTDGMGGSSSGYIASEIAVKAMEEGFRAGRAAEGEGRTLSGADLLVSAVKLANRRILDKSEHDPRSRGMGAAIAALSVAGETVQIAHVGDCRVYRYRLLEFEQLTRDHTLINEAHAFKPDITEDELAALPRNVITRALGFKDDVEVDVKVEPARAGEVYLLCSDGLYQTLSDERIAELLREHFAVEDAARALLQEALDRRANDNVTCLVVRLSLS